MANNAYITWFELDTPLAAPTVVSKNFGAAAVASPGVVRGGVSARVFGATAIGKPGFGPDVRQARVTWFQVDAPAPSGLTFSTIIGATSAASANITKALSSNFKSLGGVSAGSPGLVKLSSLYGPWSVVRTFTYSVTVPKSFGGISPISPGIVRAYSVLKSPGGVSPASPGIARTVIRSKTFGGTSPITGGHVKSTITSTAKAFGGTSPASPGASKAFSIAKGIGATSPASGGSQRLTTAPKSLGGVAIGRGDFGKQVSTGVLKAFGGISVFSPALGVKRVFTLKTQDTSGVGVPISAASGGFSAPVVTKTFAKTLGGISASVARINRATAPQKTFGASSPSSGGAAQTRRVFIRGFGGVSAGSSNITKSTPLYSYFKSLGGISSATPGASQRRVYQFGSASAGRGGISPVVLNYAVSFGGRSPSTASLTNTLRRDFNKTFGAVSLGRPGVFKGLVRFYDMYAGGTSPAVGGCRATRSRFLTGRKSHIVISTKLPRGELIKTRVGS